MGRTRRVDELARKIDHEPVVVVHAHPARIRNVGHVRHLDILFTAIVHEPFHVRPFDHHGHALLRLADRQLRRIQAIVLGRHAVQIDVQTVGQLADGHRHAAGAEVVRLLDKARHLRPAEQPFQFALFRSVALLHLRRTGFQRLGIVFLRRTRRTADAVAPRAAAQQQHHVARSGRFAPHVFGLHGSHHGTHLQTLGHVVGMIDFAHVGRGQTDLVAVARITGRSLAADDPLGQFAGERLADGLIDIARTRHTHGLVDVAAPRQRVADRTAQTGRSAAEGFDLGGVVVCLVLELQQPLFGLPVHVDVDEDRAGVVLLAHFQIVQLADFAQVTGADRGQIHQAEGFFVAAQFAADLMIQLQRLLQLGSHERLVDPNRGQHRRKGRMAAMVAPIGIQNPQFRLVGIAPLGPEIVHHLAQVVGVHRQPHLRAIGSQFTVGQLAQSREHLHGLHLGLLHVAQHREILLARLDGVDVVFAHARQLLVGRRCVQQQQPRRADAHLGFGIDQPHAVDGRRSALVELSRQILHGQEFPPFEVAGVGHLVGLHLAEHPVTARFEQFGREAEQVVDVQQTQLREVQSEVLVQIVLQALGLDPKSGAFLDENTVVLHIVQFSFFSLFRCGGPTAPPVIRIARPTRRRTARRSGPRR